MPLLPSLAPSFIAAACYMTFGRMVWWVTPVEKRTLWTLWCPPRFLTAIFVLFDLGSFFVQFLGACAVGAAYTGKDLSAEQREDGTENGLAVLKLGLVLQLVCFGIFAVVGARFLVVSRRWAGRASPYNAEKPSWRRLSWMVNLSATLITVSSFLFPSLRPSLFPGSPACYHCLSLLYPMWTADVLS